ncbi:MAG: helix-turn-helix domain-containing protein [Neomegalonema sp.]|nr:helix-turn-helix domain-containing protein [Neomegalonema sp.]
MNQQFSTDDNLHSSLLAVSPADAARLTGLGSTTIYQALGSGALPSLKVGRRRLIRIAALDAWLNELEMPVELADDAG